MPTHKAETIWTGGKDGGGEFSAENGTVKGTFAFPTWFEDELRSNPEEFIGAVHSGCFSVQLTAFLEGEGYTPTDLHIAAGVYPNPADGNDFEISRIDLTLDAGVSGTDRETFDDLTQCAEENCPVSEALAGPELTLTATFA